jgi:hypothetical protein
MGLIDTIHVLDTTVDVTCPHGHRITTLQTKDLDPSMDAYLICSGRLYRVDRTAEDADTGRWRIEGSIAIREYRAPVEEIATTRSVHAYATCSECEPILVRNDALLDWHDLVNEHRLFVDVEFRFRPGEPVQVTRTSGTLDELRNDLVARGQAVLDDEHALAIAHREVSAARDRPHRRWRR